MQARFASIFLLKTRFEIGTVNNKQAPCAGYGNRCPKIFIEES
jgi:hypothetical protein